jgi:hypothetical protein
VCNDVVVLVVVVVVVVVLLLLLLLIIIIIIIIITSDIKPRDATCHYSHYPQSFVESKYIKNCAV